MVQILYPEGCVVEVIWHGEFYGNRVVVIYIKEYRTVAELYEGMNEAIERINEMLNQ